MNYLEELERQLDHVTKTIESTEYQLMQLKGLRNRLKSAIKHEVNKGQGELFNGTN